MDSAKHGVIYFSLGSNVNSRHLPLDKKRAIIEAFSNLKEDVLFKFEDDTITNLPRNVKVGTWFPQQDILGKSITIICQYNRKFCIYFLAHPNLKLFITHGGYASTIETVHHGVPIIAIPIFGDQKMNSVYAETKGFGRILPWQDITKDTFFNMIREVIDNPK